MTSPKEAKINTPLTNDQASARLKIAADLMKHTLTLNTAMIVASLTISTKFLGSPPATSFVAALVFFLVSIFGAYLCMWEFATTSENLELHKQQNHQLTTGLFLTTIFGFILGIAALIYFVITSFPLMH